MTEPKGKCKYYQSAQDCECLLTADKCDFNIEENFKDCIYYEEVRNERLLF